MVTEAQREYGRWWRANNPDKCRAYYEKRPKGKSTVWSRNNRERANAQLRSWRKENKDRIRNANLKAKFGITADEWESMFDAQGRVCKCCGTATVKGRRAWATDHCHEQGIIRGILCHQCNIMLGMARDNPEVLLKGAEYLRASKLSET